MHWEEFQRQWQQQATPTAANAGAMADAIHADSRRLRRRVWLRDGIETGIALLMVPVFGWAAIHAGQKSAWWTVAFSILLTGWLLFLPWWLWRARRQLPVPQPERPLVDFLVQERDAVLAQARLLETVWRWCLGPVAVGVVGFYVSVTGPTRGALIYAGVVLAVYAGIDWLNRVTARRRFRARAARIDSLLSELGEEIAS